MVSSKYDGRLVRSNPRLHRLKPDGIFKYDSRSIRLNLSLHRLKPDGNTQAVAAPWMLHGLSHYVTPFTARSYRPKRVSRLVHRRIRAIMCDHLHLDNQKRTTYGPESYASRTAFPR